MTGVSTSPNGEPRGLSTYVRIMPAGEVTTFDVRGNFIRVADLSTPLPITIRNSQLDGHGVEFTNRMKKFEKIYSAMEYDGVLVQNDTDDDITITLQLGYGDYQAEIVSRTLAAQSFVSKNLAGSFEDIANNAFEEVVIVPENLQRKSIKFGVIEFQGDSGGDVSAYVGPPGVATVGAVRNLAFFNSLERAPGQMETTAAMSLYLVGDGPTASITVTYLVNYLEEVYSAA